MRQGGDDLFRLLNRGMDYVQTSFESSQGIITPETKLVNIIYSGVVIDVNFNLNESTTSAAFNPPFSVYAKIIGESLDEPDPEASGNRIYYPPLFPMHNLCIPEIGEEVLILKQTPVESSIGYYIGRANDTSALNISYAREYVAPNDASTSNYLRYGFGFDVKKLRNKYEDRLPSSNTKNISIPVTFGDVVQQGRSKTYVRHSFNRNNKEGVLEQGIKLVGRSGSRLIRNDFNYIAPGRKRKNLQSFRGVVSTQRTRDEDETETEEFAELKPREVVKVLDPDYMLGDNEIRLKSIDPSIGKTSTKTIHFIDSSIRRLGDYRIQSQVGDSQGNINDVDRSIIANLADEIYNISSKETTAAVYRQVLGEKLVEQQQQNYFLLEEVINTVSGFAESTQLLLDAFLEHTHALPKIELNLKKEIKSKDLYRTRTKIIPQPDQVIRIPGKRISIQTGTKYVEPPGNEQARAMGMEVPPVPVPIYSYTNTPSSVIRVKQPPRIIPGRMKARPVTQKINFEAIIGGEENPRFTAPIQTDQDSSKVTFNPVTRTMSRTTKTELGEKTAGVDVSLENAILNFAAQQEQLTELTQKVTNFLSKNQFIN